MRRGLGGLSGGRASWWPGSHGAVLPAAHRARGVLRRLPVRGLGGCNANSDTGVTVGWAKAGDGRGGGPVLTQRQLVCTRAGAAAPRRWRAWRAPVCRSDVWALKELCDTAQVLLKSFFHQRDMSSECLTTPNIPRPGGSCCVTFPWFRNKSATPCLRPQIRHDCAELRQEIKQSSGDEQVTT